MKLSWDFSPAAREAVAAAHERESKIITTVNEFNL